MKRNEHLTHGSDSETQESRASAADSRLAMRALAANLTQAITEALEAHPIYASMTVIATANANNVTVTVLDGQSTTVSASSKESG